MFSIVFFISISFISALIFMTSSFLSTWVLFVLLSLVALGVRLHCLFEIFLVLVRKDCNVINFPPRTAFVASVRF